MAVASAHYLYKTLPYSHQTDAFLFAWEKEYFALFMEMGTGKSKVLIDIASNLFAQGKITGVLLVAPNGVSAQWEESQIPEHSPIAYSTFLFDSATFRKKQNEYARFCQPSLALRWLCVNVEAFSYDTHLEAFRTFLRSGPCMVAVDEATRIKNPSAQRTINVIQGLANVVKNHNRIVSIAPLSAYRAILTGTPTTNNPYDLFAMTEFLKTNYFGLTFSAFRARYGLEKTDVVPNSNKRFRRRISLEEMKRIRTAAMNGKSSIEISSMLGIDPLDAKYIIDNPACSVPYKNLPELKEKLKPFAFFVRKEDCLDLPAKVYEKVLVDLSTEQKLIYKDLVAELYAEYAGRELTVLNKMTLLVRLSQVAGGFFPSNDGQGEENGVPNHNALAIGSRNPKIEALLDSLAEASFPVVITARFTAEIDSIKDALDTKTEYSSVKIHGGVGHKDRESALAQFKAGECDILVGSAGTIGIGMNLQIASTMLIFSNSYSLEAREQLEDRIHRIGQTRSCTYIDYIMKGTIDEKVHEVLRLKKDLLDYMRSTSLEEFISGGNK